MASGYTELELLSSLSNFFHPKSDILSAAPAPTIVNRIGSSQLGETDESLHKFLTGHTAKELRFQGAIH
ncbi:hypothetical protein PHPALM_30344 [Phytophthora palmivora]|uniref:Uncharacterized protein n=1 Tax=Phytophthora palmivora TaxID=4796 RepID=A0A2P4X5C9_9STRA|nr:hypothetical protein PHPALM_30344 [Phytophthora palmivora]